MATAVASKPTAATRRAASTKAPAKKATKAATKKATKARGGPSTAVGVEPDPLAGIVPPDDPDVADFSIKYKPIKFRVNGPDVFEAVPILPVPVLRELGAMHGTMDGLSTVEKFDKVLNMFDLLLTPESAKRFRERLESRDDPDSGGAIDLNRQVLPALNYLVEKFGMRPTQAAGSSSDGAGSIGDSSMDGALPEVSTPWASPLTGS